MKKVFVKANRVPLNLGLQEDKKLLYFVSEDEVKEVTVNEQIEFYLENGLLKLVEKKKPKKESKKEEKKE